MNTVVVLLALVAFAASTPLKERSKLGRRYIPEEDDPYRFKYLLFINDRGELYYEDLTKEGPKRNVTTDDVTLYLYTQQNPIHGVPIKVDELDGLTNSELYDPNKTNYFIVHGWNNDYLSTVNTALTAAILKMSDANVFVVGWGEIANDAYTTARIAVPVIGGFLGDFINNMIDHYQISSKMFRLIGHSLGAHVAGNAGAKVKDLVEYISGLDPAGPLFTVGNTENRLDETDAEFVQIVHTSSNLLGFGSAIGHADYYPNGGSSQPGCGVDVIGTCAHSRAYYYYEESILEGGFTSTECESYRSFKKGKCEDNPVSYFGSLDVDTSASGDYYCYTNPEPPFSKE